MTLSLIVPVCNDPEGARTVVRQACDLGIFAEILLSDDASEVPLHLADVMAPEIAPEQAAGPGGRPEIRILRHNERGGAGRARNLALAEATGSHVLFFDADDHLRPELVQIWHRLEAEEIPFDFCIFRHVEERSLQEGHPGMFPKDEALWLQAGLRQELAPLDPEAAPILAQVAAYPWNKIYRTDFLRAHAVRCSETLVHNDIALHWLGFLKAERILYSTARGCDHVLGTVRNHLTHRRGRERLQVFDALRDVLAVAGPLSPEWEVAYARFYLDLLIWARARVAPEDLAEFDRLAQQFVRGQMTAVLFTQINLHSPDLGRHCLDLMMGGPPGRG